MGTVARETEISGRNGRFGRGPDESPGEREMSLTLYYATTAAASKNHDP